MHGSVKWNQSQTDTCILFWTYVKFPPSLATYNLAGVGSFSTPETTQETDEHLLNANGFAQRNDRRIKRLYCFTRELKKIRRIDFYHFVQLLQTKPCWKLPFEVYHYLISTEWMLYWVWWFHYCGFTFIMIFPSHNDMI